MALSAQARQRVRRSGPNGKISSLSEAARIPCARPAGMPVESPAADGVTGLRRVDAAWLRRCSGRLRSGPVTMLQQQCVRALEGM